MLYDNGSPYPKIGTRRQLLDDIASQPLKNGVCWYHIKHGKATNPRNCPGLEHRMEEITKMKSTIAKLQQSSTPAQKRLTMAPSSASNPMETDQINHDWNQLVDAATNKTESKLEEDFLLSDAE